MLRLGCLLPIVVTTALWTPITPPTLATVTCTLFDPITCTKTTGATTLNLSITTLTNDQLSESNVIQHTIHTTTYGIRSKLYVGANTTNTILTNKGIKYTTNTPILDPMSIKPTSKDSITTLYPYANTRGLEQYTHLTWTITFKNGIVDAWTTWLLPPESPDASLQHCTHIRLPYNAFDISNIQEFESDNELIIALQPTTSRDCTPITTDIRTFDGSCNNPHQPTLGTAFDVRFGPTVTESGFDCIRADHGNRSYNFVGEDVQCTTPTRTDLPDPRRISTDILIDNLHGDTHAVNLLHTFLGQFIGHDLVDTKHRSTGEFIANTPDDMLYPSYTRLSIGATYVAGLNQYNQPKYVNLASTWLDLSPIYGSNDHVAGALRTYEGGRLRTAETGLSCVYEPENYKDFRKCTCINTTSGQLWGALDEPDHRQYFQLLRQFGFTEGYTPEPLPGQPLTTGTPCYSPVADVDRLYSDPRLESARSMCGWTIPSGTPDRLITPCGFGQSGIIPARVVTDVNCTVAPHADGYAHRFVFDVMRDWQPRATLVPDAPVDTATTSIHNAFVSGDRRNVENIGVFSLHNLFLREHNRLAKLLDDGTLTDEEVFQRARATNIAAYQRIVYNQWLPIVLGHSLHTKYQIHTNHYHYDSEIDPRINTAFANAAMRFGHSTIPFELFIRQPNTPHERIPLPTDFVQRPRNSQGPRFPLEQSTWRSLPGSGQIGPYTIANSFAFAGGEDNIMSTLLYERGRRVDERIADPLRDTLITLPFLPGTIVVDVATLNIERGRNMGLPDYNTIRTAYHPEGSIYMRDDCPRTNGTDALACFNAFIGDITVATKVRNHYQRVDNIDLWVGLLLESGQQNQHVVSQGHPYSKTGIVGPTTAHIIAEQFLRTRDGDRLFQHGDTGLGLRLLDLVTTHYGVNTQRGRANEQLFGGIGVFLADNHVVYNDIVTITTSNTISHHCHNWLMVLIVTTILTS